MAVGWLSVWRLQHMAVTSISDQVRRSGSVLPVSPPVH